jgi:methylphosphotriester-DNA--protein-cysteine methyltransferase
MEPYNSEAGRWKAVVARDPEATSAFVYCVKTTKIYCRPTCKARLARRANVTFQDSPTEAEEAGYRACKRCLPNASTHDPHSELIERACKSILSSEGQAISLNELSKQAGLSKSYFHRVFKRSVGMSPRALEQALKQSRNESSSPNEPLTPEMIPKEPYPIDSATAYFLEYSDDFSSSLFMGWEDFVMTDLIEGDQA